MFSPIQIVKSVNVIVITVTELLDSQARKQKSNSGIKL